MVSDARHDLSASRQVHGKAVVVATRERATARPGDIIVNARSARWRSLCKRADCVPLLFADPPTGAVAAAHAGWRGTGRRCPRGGGAAAMTATFGSRARRISFVALGPSIGACCYEVGRDVREAFGRAGFSARTDSIGGFQSEPKPLPPTRRWQGLRAHAPSGSLVLRWLDARCAISCEAAGVPPDQIFSADLCTASHPRRLLFLSARRHAGGAHGGRDQVPAAPSIAVFASRSACLLASRRTCSNVTRPISRASSRALACSGCSPGCFTL